MKTPTRVTIDHNTIQVVRTSTDPDTGHTTSAPFDPDAGLITRVTINPNTFHVIRAFIDPDTGHTIRTTRVTVD